MKKMLIHFSEQKENKFSTMAYEYLDYDSFEIEKIRFSWLNLYLEEDVPSYVLNAIDKPFFPRGWL